MLIGIFIKTKIMAQIAHPAHFKTNSKEPKKQCLTKYARSKSPKSSFNVRPVRQAHVIDPDFKDQDLEFDKDNIIEYDEEDTNVLDELCDFIEGECNDSPPPATSDSFHHKCSDWEK